MAEEDRPDGPAADEDVVDELSAEVSLQAPDEGAERLAEESTATIVEVLQQVHPSTAQDLLASLPEERQQDVAEAAPESSRQWALNQTFPEGCAEDGLRWGESSRLPEPLAEPERCREVEGDAIAAGRGRLALPDPDVASPDVVVPRAHERHRALP
jgi:hypothetical protein